MLFLFSDILFLRAPPLCLPNITRSSGFAFSKITSPYHTQPSKGMRQSLSWRGKRHRIHCEVRKSNQQSRCLIESHFLKGVPYICIYTRLHKQNSWKSTVLTAVTTGGEGRIIRNFYFQFFPFLPLNILSWDCIPFSKVSSSKQPSLMSTVDQVPVVSCPPLLRHSDLCNSCSLPLPPLYLLYPLCSLQLQDDRDKELLAECLA